MKIFDISQEVFSCEVYPGDREPKKIEEMRIEKGDLYNLSSFEMCAHNGTHIDAPFHFINGGDTIKNIPLFKTVGYAFVIEQDEDITKEKAEQILSLASEFSCDCKKRILIKGKGEITLECAKVFADNGVYLIGVEGQTVGPKNAPMAVHKILLEKGVVLLEGLRLNGLSNGVYFLCAQPLNLGGFDGAPTRAILIKE